MTDFVRAWREQGGKAPFLKFGDRVKIEMLDADGRSVFGAIDQVIAPLSKT